MSDYNLITDRTQADVDNDADKGYYNCTDLNRVGEAMADLAQLLADRGYIIDVQPKTDWSMSDIPTQTQLDTCLAQVTALRAALPVWPDTPQVPDTMTGLTYQQANHIEKILVDLWGILESMRKIALRTAQPLVFCGFSLYPSHAAPESRDLPIYTSDGIQLFTADGLALYIRQDVST